MPAFSAPDPNIGRTLTGGAYGPCTWFIYLSSGANGNNIPIANAQVPGLSVNPGDNIIGTASQDIGAFVNSLITSTNEHLCFDNGIFKVATTILYDANVRGDHNFVITGSGAGGCAPVIADCSAGQEGGTYFLSTGANPVIKILGINGDPIDNPVVEYLTIDGGGFGSGTGDGALDCTTCYGGDFHDIRVMNSGNVGIYLTGSSGEQDKIHDCQVDDNHANGITLILPTAVTRCDVWNNNSVAGLACIQIAADRSTVSYSTFDGTSKHGIFIGGAKYVHVTDNFVANVGGLTTNTYDGIHIESASSYDVISGNTVVQDYGSVQTNKGRFGIGLSGDNSNLLIESNTIVGTFATSGGGSGGAGHIGFFVIPTAAVFTIVYRNNIGYDPFGMIVSPFASSPNTMGPFGNSPGGTPLASTVYNVILIDQQLTCTGGTATSITIKDSLGATFVSGVSCTSNPVFYMSVGETINFGAFTGTAPTVSVLGM